MLQASVDILTLTVCMDDLEVGRQGAGVPASLDSDDALQRFVDLESVRLSESGAVVRFKMRLPSPKIKIKKKFEHVIQPPRPASIFSQIRDFAVRIL